MTEGPVSPFGLTTVRELIARTVEDELQVRQQLKKSARMRVVLLYDYAVIEGVEPNLEESIARAIDAFEAAQYDIFLDGKRLENLDQVVDVQLTSDLIFLPRTDIRSL